MEKGLAMARENADRANHLKDAFISNISHEIRTPLNAILGFSDLIREETEGKVAPEAISYFTIIEKSCQRLMHTVELMLDLSKLQTGMYAPTRSIVDMEYIINLLIDEHREDADKKHLVIRYTNLAGPIKLSTDAYCIRQAIDTLLNNAVKYTPKGSVTITLDRISDKELQLEVADTGIGMHPEYIRSIFEPFSQEETGMTKTFAGIGLSLSIAKKMLNTIGASISFTSQPGKGSVFTILLPVA